MPLAGAADNNNSVNWRLMLPLLIVVIAYIVIGAAIFYALEIPAHRAHEGIRRKAVREFMELYPDVEFEKVVELLNNFSREIFKSTLDAHHFDSSNLYNDGPMVWEFSTAVYFVVTVITTIGYGDVIPITSQGRLFCIVYAMIGIPMCLVLLANVGGALYIVIKRIDNKVICLKLNPKRAKAVRTAALFSIGLCFFVMLPAYMFYSVEQWAFTECVYYAFITLSTVGLGDYVAKSAWYPFSVIVWLFLGLAWLSTTINSTQELITELLGDKGSTSKSKAHRSIKRQVSQQNGKPAASIGHWRSSRIKSISQPSVGSEDTVDTMVDSSPSGTGYSGFLPDSYPAASTDYSRERTLSSPGPLPGLEDELRTYTYEGRIRDRAALSPQGAAHPTDLANDLVQIHHSDTYSDQLID